MAPQAMVIKAKGKIFPAKTGPEPSMKRVSGGMCSVGRSTREREVLRHIAEGASNKEIAQQLGISVRTVESHRDSLMRKVGIKSVAGLTRLALRSGLISDET